MPKEREQTASFPNIEDQTRLKMGWIQSQNFPFTVFPDRNAAQCLVEITKMRRNMAIENNNKLKKMRRKPHYVVPPDEYVKAINTPFGPAFRIITKGK